MSLTLARLATQFIDRPGLAKTTRKSYEQTLMPLLALYGAVPIEEVTRKMLVEYLDSLDVAYTTHRRHASILQALMNYGVEEGAIASNPIEKLKSRKPNPERGECNDEKIRYLTPEQIQVLYNLLDYRRDWRLHALVRLLHSTGARISEVLALNLDNLDWDGQKFRVVGKGNKSRWCYFSAETARILSIYIEHYCTSYHPALFQARHPTTGVISRLAYGTAYQDWVELVKLDKQLKGCRLHDLRHTFATERVGLMHIEELQALMGHEDIKITLRYAKVTSQRAETVAKRAFQILSNGV